MALQTPPVGVELADRETADHVLGEHFRRQLVEHRPHVVDQPRPDREVVDHRLDQLGLGDGAQRQRLGE